MQALQDIAPIAWPELPLSSKPPLTRLDARRRQCAPPSYLQRLLALTRAEPGKADDGATVAYKALLDRVLEDRRVEECEVDALLETAAAWGLDGPQLVLVHESYLSDLATAALADGVVTSTERRDLEHVARLLGLEHMNLESLLCQAAANPATPRLLIAEGVISQTSLAGKSVCFTGELCCNFAGEPLSRPRAEELAAGAGLVIANSVTKSLDILVVADPLTQSGKAKKARQYDVRIMHEPVFWRTIGVDVH
jgi:DNA polymerase-3 subunit epsilon